MGLRDAALGALGGLLLGWVLGGMGAGRNAAVQLVRTSPAAECPPAPECPPTAPRVAATGDAAALLAAQEAQIRDLSVEAFGRPLAWPEPGDRDAADAAFRAALTEACAPGVRLVEAECSEPPCLFALDLGAGKESLDEVCPTLWERAGLSSYSSMQRPCGDGGFRLFTVMHGSDQATRTAAEAVPGVDPGENQRTRVRIRTKDLMDTFACPE